MKKFFYIFSILFFLVGCSNNYEKRMSVQLGKEGDILYSKGKIHEAIDKWEKALSFKKQSKIYEKIVVALIIKKENKEAKKWVEEGLTYFPNCVNLIYNHAFLNVLDGKYNEAIEEIDRLLEINPYYPEAHFMKGMIFEKIGKRKEAKKEYIKEVNINPGCKKAWKKIKEMQNETK